MKTTSKKEKAIVLVTTGDFKFAIAPMLLNFQEKNRHNYDDIVIYHEGLTQADQEDLRKIEPNLIFIPYTLEKWKKEHNIPDVMSGKLQHYVNKFSYQVSLKYKAFEQLANYRKVLFMELDMIVQDDLSELFALEGFAWRTETTFLRKFGSQHDKPALTETIPENFPAPNGGLFYVTDILDWQKCYEEAKFFLMRYFDYFSVATEELALAWVAYRQGIKVIELAHTEYNVLPKVASRNSKIIHFMGSQKQWNTEMYQLAYPQWMNNYYTANRIADFSSERVKDFGTHGNILMRKHNETHWLSFLQQTDLSIPDTLKLRFKFDEGQLYIDYKKDIFYEIIPTKNTEDYHIALTIKNKQLALDKEVKALFKELAERNEQFTLREVSTGITLFTKRQHISQIPTLWDYFYRVTEKALAYF